MDKTSFLFGPPPRGRRFRARLCAGALAAAALAGGASRAGATLGIGPVVERMNEDERRPSSQFPLWISHQDCLTDNGLKFKVTLSQGSYQRDDVLSIWASQEADCKDPRERLSSGLCRFVSEQSDLTQDNAVEVPAKKIAEALGVTDCKDNSSSTSARKVVLHFMLLRETQETVAADDAATWTETHVDLLGPRPPEGVKVGSGDTRLIVEYSPSDDADTLGHYLFCDDSIVSSTGTGGGATGGGGDVDAGAGGGVDAGSTAAGGSSSCGSTKLVPGEVPDPSLSRCGSAGKTGAGEAEGLQNGVPYAVGVAAYDSVGNSGVLSNIACGVPVDVDSFFELYREAGGQAGGGFCSVAGPVGAGRWLSVPLGAMVAGAALGMWRRTRRRRARPSTQEHG
ncbi:hypothetical protein WME89_12790 [Sorangium sp. So ce321]|uniref:hypothetical protein n=1 Tax=Sorangium sp. So ce321 TaxID=3133300 RepID=UPI003F63FA17